MKFNQSYAGAIVVVSLSAFLLIGAQTAEQVKTQPNHKDKSSAAAQKSGRGADREEDFILEKLKEAKGRAGETRGPSCNNQECRGTGRASHFVKGDNCPSPCDPNEYKDWTDKLAKERAKRDATVNCRILSHYDECDCKDGDYTIKEKGCIPVTILGVNYCEYFIEYEYKGTCKQK